jgi:hypothetical protein
MWWTGGLIYVDGPQLLLMTKLFLDNTMIGTGVILEGLTLSHAASLGKQYFYHWDFLALLVSL